MANVNGGQLFGQALKKEGIDCIFTLSGGHIMPILYGCRDNGIRVVDVRHECAGGYAADAYGRVRGIPGVLITTAGPGITNATTAMAESYQAGTPLVHIGGASPRMENDTGPLQDVMSFEAMEVFSKWARKIHDAHRIPEYVAMAFRHAMDGTPGPVYLEIAAELLVPPVPEERVTWPEKYRAYTQPYGDPQLIEQAADWLVNAKKPAMAVGDLARYSAQDRGAVEELANYLKLPVMVGNLARGLFADESENELFRIGTGAAGFADVLVELAVEHNYRFGKGRPPVLNGKRIMINPDVTKIGYNAPADIGIIAGASAGARQLLNAVKAKTGPRTDETWLTEARAINAKAIEPYTKAAKSDISPIHPGRVAAEVVKFIEGEARDWHVVCDGGDAGSWIDNMAVAHYPGQVVRYGPLGTIGTGAGFTTGAYMADGKPVLYYSGDGSFGFYPMEFDTFLRHNVPVVSVISNDSAWGMIKLSQAVSNKEYVDQKGHCATELAHMRAYHELPKMWDGVGILVTEIKDIIPAIRAVRDSGKPGIVNVQVDQEVMSPATESFAGKK